MHGQTMPKQSEIDSSVQNIPKYVQLFLVIEIHAKTISTVNNLYIYICVTNKFRMKTTMQEVVESVCFLSESIEVFPPGGHGVPRPVLVGASSLQHIGRSWSMAALINSNGNSRLWPRVFFIALGRFLESWDTASVSNKGYGAVSKLFRTPPSSLLPSNKAHSVAWGSVCGRMHGLVSTLLLSCSLTSVFPTPRNF